MLLEGIRASLVLIVIYATIHVNGETEPIDIIPCNGDMEFIPGGTPGSCYSMMPVLWGKMDNRNARIYCLMDNNNVFSLLPTPQTHGELQRLTEWAIRQGLPRSIDPNDDPAGFWLGYYRFQPAPLEQPGDRYTPAVKAIRTDKSLFFERDRITFAMPDIWRLENQPGDMEDERDERCVAKKKPANPYFMGADDYACDKLHYVVCESPLWARKAGAILPPL